MERQRGSSGVRPHHLLWREPENPFGAGVAGTDASFRIEHHDSFVEGCDD
jgi:hypothetical protein